MGGQSIESTSQSSTSCLGRCLLYNRSHHFECLPVNPAQKGNVKNADLEHVQGMHAKFMINDRVWLMSYKAMSYIPKVLNDSCCVSATCISKVPTTEGHSPDTYVVRHVVAGYDSCYYVHIHNE